MAAKKSSNKEQAVTEEVTIDGKYIAEVKATTEKLSKLVAPMPVEAILMWIDAHADDEETIETVNKFTFLYTKKYRNGRY